MKKSELRMLVGMGVKTVSEAARIFKRIRR